MKADTVVLSGGSTSGLLTLGRLHSLQKQGKLTKIKLWCGTSIGAIIALLMCCGYTAEQIAAEIAVADELFAKLLTLDVRRAASGRGIFSQIPIEQEVRRMVANSPAAQGLTRELQCRDLTCRFVCCSFNFQQKILCYHDSQATPTADPVMFAMASSAIPFLFEPRLLNGECHVDGGLVDNFPIAHAEFLGAKSIIAILIDKTEKTTTEPKQNWQHGDVLGLVFAASGHITDQQLKSCKVKLDLHRLTSSIPFYDMQVDKKMVAEMFMNGMMPDTGCNLM